MSRKILLITGNDNTYRRPLLEAQGYTVEMVQDDKAISTLAKNGFHLVLVSTESGVSNAFDICKRMKAVKPEIRVGVLANDAEIIPKGNCFDVIIRAQYSPAKFIGAINTLLKSLPSLGTVE